MYQPINKKPINRIMNFTKMGFYNFFVLIKQIIRCETELYNRQDCWFVIYLKKKSLIKTDFIKTVWLQEVITYKHLNSKQ